MPNDLSRVRDALSSIPPDLAHEEWVRVGMAVHSAGLPFDEFDAWSAVGATYDARAVQAAWRSFKADGRVGPGTLFDIAKRYGHRPSRDRRSIQQRTTKATSNPAPSRKAPRPGMGAVELWDRFEPATADHEYIARKDGRPDGLRVVPAGDSFCIARSSVAGWLVVPVTPIGGGDPVSLQFIPPPGEGKKLNLPGASVAGVFIVGDLEQAGTAYLCEGIGQAWACWKATGCAAVVAFGWGRVRAVAAELRQRDDAARLVIVPDAGKEDEAEKIAAELGAEWVEMPEGSPSNFDANDYAKEHGHDALEVLLGQTNKAPEPEPHPLARFVDLADAPEPPRMVIPGFIQDGVVVIAGAHGAGKTTALVPLAMIAAGVHAVGDPLAPRRWRHVVYIAEDVPQVLRISQGIVGHAGIGASLATVRERFHVVPALRLPAEEVAEAAQIYRARFTRRVDGVDLLPLVVIDTKSATLELADENDNAEVGRLVAMLKQRLHGLPLWLVGHVAKALLARKDVQALSMRGASAIEADSHQSVFLVIEDDGRRFLVLGKRRFEPKWHELEINSATAEITARNEFGEDEPMTLRWGLPAPPQQTRAEAAQEAREVAVQEERNALRAAILDAVEAAERTGTPLSRRGARDAVGGRSADAGACVGLLLDELWLYAVPVPAGLRTNPNRKEFLIRLNDAERRAVLGGQALPSERLEVPASWRKPVGSGREPTGAAGATE